MSGGKEYEKRVRRVRTRLVEAQRAIGEAGEVAFAVGISGDDRRGVHRLMNRLFEWMDARYMDARVHGRPHGSEREQPFLARMWRDCPRKGRGAVFVRAAPHQVLSERVRGRLKRKAFDERLEQIRRLETMWACEGVRLVKLWLTVSAKEHARRRERRNDLDRWRQKQVDRTLVADLADGGEVARAVRDGTDHPHAPWHVLDGENPRERDLRAAEIVADALEEAAKGRTCEPVEVELEGVSGKMGRRVEEMFDPARLDRKGPDEETYRDRLRRLRDEITENALEALQDERSTVVVLQGWDAAGKGGAIRRAIPALDPAFYRAISVSAPNEIEKARPYLWRFWRDLPRPGHVRFFDRSWYGRVLVERVEGYANEGEWKRAYEEIVDFERQIVDAGTRVVKVWLEISDEEQLRRFRAREETPEKRHKIGEEDWRNREKRGEYEVAAREMVARTHRDWAPWVVVPAENKRAARLEFLEVVRDVLGSG